APFLLLLLLLHFTTHRLWPPLYHLTCRLCNSLSSFWRCFRPLSSFRRQTRIHRRGNPDDFISGACGAVEAASSASRSGGRFPIPDRQVHLMNRNSRGRPPLTFACFLPRTEAAEDEQDFKILIFLTLQINENSRSKHVFLLIFLCFII
ncbi:unnamed protein product, partial [Linum tenue]